MHLPTTVAVASLLAASSVAALGEIAGRHPNSLVRDLKTSFKRSSHPAMAKRLRRKRATPSNTKKLCRVRPTNALTNSPPPATQTNAAPTSPAATTSKPPASNPTNNPDNTPTGDSPWKLKVSHQGSSFFDGWDFWSYGDPTHGIVDYQDAGSAWNNKLIEVNGDGHAIMRVETTPRVSGNRKSIRIHDQYVFNGGLLIMDAVHMPHGCGTWPAWWTNGPDWPNKGEIDILEGVHDSATNQVSIHTGPGCRIADDVTDTVGVLSGGSNCASSESGNSGCGMVDNNTNSYGSGFNQAGGGVYAMKWDDSGIAVYFFSRANVPADLNNGAPHPETWPKPVANYKAAMCNPWQFFKDHFAIFDTTLCGDWAGSPGAWSGSGCAASTGYGTCEQFVRENGSAFNDAYWEVKYVKLYQM